MSAKKTASSRQSEIARLKAEIELLTGTSTDVVYRLRYDTMRYEYISPSVMRLLGFTPEELAAMSLRSLILETRVVSDTIRPVASFAPLEQSRARGEVLKWQADYLMKTKDGRKLWVGDVSYPWFDAKGAIIGSMGTLRDISDRVAAEARARQGEAMARDRDALTGCLTPEALLAAATEEMKRLRRRNADLALLLVACEKEGAQTQEHRQGLLRGIAGLLRRAVRETDLLARSGEAEFALLLPDTPMEGALRLGARIRQALGRGQEALGAAGVGMTVACGASSIRFDAPPDAEGLYRAAQSRLFLALHDDGQTLSAPSPLMNVH